MTSEQDEPTAEQVRNYLKKHPDFCFDYFVSNATKQMVTAWSTQPDTGQDSKSADFRSETRNSLTTDIFHSYVDGKRPKRLSTVRDAVGMRSGKSEEELFMDLICDISHELDVNTLSHKILTNVSLLTSSDRGSLFLARGPPGKRYLIPQLFDVTQDSMIEDVVLPPEKQFHVPFGVGIAGIVAQTKKLINIKNAYEDPRFNNTIDQQTGYRTHSILCMPILNHEGEVVGVAQIINKTTGSHEFTDNDEKLFRKYLVFCGIGLTNAQLFEMSVREYKRNQLLLDLARSIFEEQTCLEKVINKIMHQAQELLHCSRCTVFLVDKPRERELLQKIHQNINGKELWSQSCLPSPGVSPAHVKQSFSFQSSTENEDCLEISFSKVFDLVSTGEESEIKLLSEDELKSWRNAEIAKYVGETGEVLNIPDLDADDRFRNCALDSTEATASRVTFKLNDVTYPLDDAITWPDGGGPGGVQTTSLLCIPIYDSDHHIIGVAQLSNKQNGNPFNEVDTNNFETFAIFCGLGIHNTQMYESACKLMAKQAVALEVLSYHATAPSEEVKRFQLPSIPTAEKYGLLTYEFSDFTLDDEDTVKATIRMFIDCGAAHHYKIPHSVLTRWVLSVKKNYRPVIYHNWRHAFNVMQSMFTMIYTGGMNKYISRFETFLLLVACISHDLDHRGTNNTFQTKVESPLARLYSTSTMEHHHFDHCIMILNSEGNNILQSLSPEDYRRGIQMLEAAILSTDLALYFKKRGSFQKLVDAGEKDWCTDEKKELLRGMMMTACDVAAITKPWEVQKNVAQLVAREFFEQGDLERHQLNEEPIAMMDRKKRKELPSMQVGFIDAICTPIYQAFSELNSALTPMLVGCTNNRHQWQSLADNPNSSSELRDLTKECDERSTQKTSEPKVRRRSHGEKTSPAIIPSEQSAQPAQRKISPTSEESSSTAAHSKDNEKSTKSKTCVML